MNEYINSLKEDWEDALIEYKDAKRAEVYARVEINDCLGKLHELHNLIVKELK